MKCAAKIDRIEKIQKGIDKGRLITVEKDDGFYCSLAVLESTFKSLKKAFSLRKGSRVWAVMEKNYIIGIVDENGVGYIEQD